MTEVRYIPVDEHHVRISIHGHAEFRPEDDPVCAAISNTTCQLINWMQMYDGKFVSDLAMEAISGNVTLNFRVLAPTVWELIWEYALIGYAQIAQEYPDNLTILEG